MSLSLLDNQTRVAPGEFFSQLGGGGGGGGSGNFSTVTTNTLSVSSISTSAPDGVAFPNGLTTAGGVSVTSIVGGSNNLSIIVDNNNPPQSTVGLYFQTTSAGATQNSLFGVAYNKTTISGHEEFLVSFPGGEMSISTNTVNIQNNLNVSSINGFPVSGGGGSVLPLVSSIPISVPIEWDSGTGLKVLSPPFNVNAGSTYQINVSVDNISCLTSAVAGDRLVFGADALSLQLVDLTAQSNNNLHNPKGFQMSGIWQPAGATTQAWVYCNGGAPSTIVNFALNNMTLIELS